ncbi:hypothetical protein [Nannocystis pusilla]|uniref:hypothetical protein n=1 Tax=Nannocystis pusilla TaxID=889268 RepID=UPI003DA1DE88
MRLSYRLSSARLGLVLAITAAACTPGPDATTDATSPDTGDSSSTTAMTDPTTSTGAAQQPFSAELVRAYLESISGCSLSSHVQLRIRVTAPPDQAIESATLTSVSFTDWWSSTDLEVVAETEDLPVAAGATAELRFYMSFEGGVGGLSDCGEEPLPSPPVVATFVVAGEGVELAGTGSLGCGWDEPAETGC